MIYFLIFKCFISNLKITKKKIKENKITYYINNEIEHGIGAHFYSNINENNLNGTIKNQEGYNTNIGDEKLSVLGKFLIKRWKRNNIERNNLTILNDSDKNILKNNTNSILKNNYFDINGKIIGSNRITKNNFNYRQIKFIVNKIQTTPRNKYKINVTSNVLKNGKIIIGILNNEINHIIQVK